MYSFTSLLLGRNHSFDSPLSLNLSKVNEWTADTVSDEPNGHFSVSTGNIHNIVMWSFER